MQGIYTADFETNNSDKAIAEQKTNIWLWDVCDCVDYQHVHGTTMESFIEYLLNFKESITIYFHNLKFDGDFLVYGLLTNGFTHTRERKIEVNEFQTLITDKKVWYSIKICTHGKGHKKKTIIEIRDSFKKITNSVENIAKAFNLPILKEEIDYTLDRPIGYVPTAKEIEYIEHDTEIMARVLNQLYGRGLTKLTASSDTMNLYKQSLGEKIFKILFPQLTQHYDEDKTYDDFIRKSYRGGCVIPNNFWKGKIINEQVFVYDINSMYPDQMCNEPLPYGTPKQYKGKYKYDEEYPLYIQEINVCMKVKSDKQPTILMSNMRQYTQKYVYDTDYNMINLVLTSVDLELMFNNYNVYEIEYVGGLKFAQSYKLFRRFMLPIYEQKCNTKGAEKEMNKLLLNGLYGKFATNPKHCQRYPELVNGKVEYKLGEVTIDDMVYTAVSSFITAYSRKDLFNVINSLPYECFVYCDTDSVHTTRHIDPSLVDPKELGKWKHERTFVKSKYLAQKTYYGIEQDGSEYKKIAGCSQNVKNKMTFDLFEFGTSLSGNLKQKQVKGGVVLIDNEFTLKPR